jgi:hypothetical protein
VSSETGTKRKRPRLTSGPVVVKSGKTAATGITPATVRTLERAGSHESAKIAREIVKK